MHGTTILKYTSVCSVILNLVIARRPTWKWRVETSSVYRGQSTREAAPPRPSCGAPWTRALRLHRKEAPIPVCRPSWSARMQRLGAACFKCCLRLCRHVGSQERGYQSGNETGHATGLADPAYPEDLATRDYTVLCPQNMPPPPLITDISTLVAQKRKK